MLRLYNYLTRKKELFKSLIGDKVGLYTCGPTVYNYAHIGNFRTYIFEDVLRRALEHSGYRVTHVMNITDVDDKTIRNAKKAGKSLQKFTRFYEKEFFKDAEKLNLLRAAKYPRATSHIKEMVGLIRILLKKKLAYKTADGVYFDISKFRPYGKLSHLKKKELRAGLPAQAGARVAADEYEKNEARDFALWKAKKPGEPFWNADFEKGRLAPTRRGEVRPGIVPGRPGWHIECSAMSMKYLGTSFDIHAGGVDLVFPHHEDEIAQSEGATGKPFVKYFVEAEHLLVDGKKMSKSLGNIYTLHDLGTKGFDPLDFRYLVLGAHYRTQLNFTWEALEAARHTRLGILNSLARLGRGPYGGTLHDEAGALKVVAATERQFREAVENDLNTSKAIAALNGLLHYGNALLDKKLLTARAASLIRQASLEFDRVLGLNLKKPSRVIITGNITELVQKRESLRKEKKWKEADAIREKIKKLGVTIEDTPAGPQIRKA